MLFPRLRSDILFALTFFTTRIMLHIILCISYILPHNRAHTTDGSILPFTVLTLIFPLHAFWFHGCVKGFLKRSKVQSASAATPLAISAEMVAEMASATLTNPAPDTTAARHSAMTVPGSFALPPLRLSLRSTQRSSTKHRKRNIRETFAGNNLRTRSLERA